MHPDEELDSMFTSMCSADGTKAAKTPYTLAVAGNYVDGAGIERCREEVMKFRHDGDLYDDLRSTVLQPDFDTSVNYDQKDVPWKEYGA